MNAKIVDEQRVKQLLNLCEVNKLDAHVLMASQDPVKRKRGEYSKFFAECIEYVLHELGLKEVGE